MIELKLSEELIQKALEEANETLGLDTYEGSYTTELFRIILGRDLQLGEKIRAEVEAKSGRNLTREELDQLYGSIYGIPRMKLEANNYKILRILNSSEMDITIELDQVLKIGKIYYSSQEDIVLKAGTITDWNVFLDLTVFEKTNLIAISSLVSLDITNRQDLAENIGSIICTEILEPSLESDEDYKARCQNLTQNFGFNNIQKIKSMAMAIPTLLRLTEVENKYGTDLIIIPKTMESIASTKTYLMQIVDYFKGSKINVLEPSVMQIDIEGFMDSFSTYILGEYTKEELTAYKEEIFQKIDAYISELNTITGTKAYEPKQVELIIDRWVVEKDFDFVVDENKMKHKISLYQRESYTEASTSYYLDRTNKKTISTDIIVLKTIS